MIRWERQRQGQTHHDIPNLAHLVLGLDQLDLCVVEVRLLELCPEMGKGVLNDLLGRPVIVARVGGARVGGGHDETD